LPIKIERSVSELFFAVKDKELITVYVLAMVGHLKNVCSILAHKCPVELQMLGL
jgi:hypothetical protein